MGLRPSRSAKVTELQTANRPCKETHAERREGGEQGDLRVEFREEQLSENEC